MIRCLYNRISSPCLLFLPFPFTSESEDFSISKADSFFDETLVAFPYFLYMLVKITGKQKEGWKVFQKSKGRQELHSGLLWIQTIFHLKIFFFASAEVRTRKDFTLSPTSSVAYF